MIGAFHGRQHNVLFADDGTGTQPKPEVMVVNLNVVDLLTLNQAVSRILGLQWPMLDGKLLECLHHSVSVALCDAVTLPAAV